MKDTDFHGGEISDLGPLEKPEASRSDDTALENPVSVTEDKTAGGQKVRGSTSVLSVRELAELSVLCALMIGGKEVMNVLPNIHPVMLILLLCVRVYGAKALFPVGGFVIVETLFYGISLWTASYLYIWPLYALAALPFRKSSSRLFWAVYAGLCGLFFGFLSAFVTLALSGFKAAAAYWIAGIPFDVIHCVSNFVLCFLLLPLLYELVMKLRAGRNLS